MDQVIISGKETFIKAYLPNPVSTASLTSWCCERNGYYSFQIKLAAENPNEIILGDENVEREDVLIAA